MSQRRCRGEWEELVRACARSGVSARRFAEGAGVNVATLLWWRSRLGRRACVEATSPAPRLVELVRPSAPGGAAGKGEVRTLTPEPAPAVRVRLGSTVVVFEALPPPEYLVALAAEYGATAS